jgi:pyrroloquinoline quinone biosynthesis protein B
MTCLPADVLATNPDGPFLVVLGIAQDGGVPQAGDKIHPGWDDPTQRRLAASLAIVDPASKQRWLVDATPDFREQLHRLDSVFPVDGKPGLAGILLTHAHMGHYTGLMHLGLEAMGAQRVPVYAMPRMEEYLRTNGPWSQLVRYENIELRPLDDGATVKLNERLQVTPLLVPHRQEYSEVVGFLIAGPRRAALYIPDIDKWEDWDAQGTRIEAVLAKADVAYLDGTFFAFDEIPGRDMSAFPHPFIRPSLERFATLPASERAKVRFIHLNHTNPALSDTSAARREIEAAGCRVAEEMERFEL